MANYPQTTTTAFTGDIVLTNGGKVGIGVTDPATALAVLGPITVQNDPGLTSFLANSGAGKIYLSSAGGSFPFDYNGNLIIQARTAASNSANIVFAAGRTTPTARVVITEYGKVGIGSTSPANALDVNGAIRMGVFTNANRGSAASVGQGTMIWNSDDNAPNFSDGSNWRDAVGNIT